MGTRRIALAAVAVLLGVVGCADGGRGAEASCAGPDVRVSPVTVAPGDDVRVRARFLFTDCYDTGQTGTPPPSRGVEVTFRAGDRTVPLTTLDAEEDGTIDATVQVPDDAPSGPAQIAVDFATADVVVEPPA